MHVISFYFLLYKISLVGWLVVGGYLGCAVVAAVPAYRLAP
jgi:hypothetical protein